MMREAQIQIDNFSFTRPQPCDLESNLSQRHNGYAGNQY
jgi:hypothetical protein